VKTSTGSLKCNIEAALFKDDNSFGCGICISDDEQGFMVERRSTWFRGTPTLIEAEAHGMMQALKWLQGKEMHHTVLETDCMQVVEGVRSLTKSTNFLFCFLSSSLNIISNLFHCYEIQNN
jgi:ribonuclease HI